MQYSIIEYFGHDTGYPCGYCKQENTSLAHGMWAHKLSCQDYEDLLNRGWRRSGKYCYKPIMNKTCCPQYTIRCDVGNIKLSKSQKKVIKRFNAFISTGKRPLLDDTSNEMKKVEECADTSRAPTDLNLSKDDSEFSLDISIDSSTVPRSPSQSKNISMTSSLELAGEKEMKNIPRGPDPDKPPCRKAKDIRRERKLKKLAEKSDMNCNQESRKSDGNESKEKTIEDFIEGIPANAKHKFEVKLIGVNEKQFVESFTTEFQLYCKYQRTIHEDPPEKLNERRIKTVCCCPQSPGFKTSYIAEYELFKKYQMSIHKEAPEDCDEKQFRRFLVDGPLQHVTKDDVDQDDNIPSTGLGAFHQQYLIDGKLVAVGVMDILPHCVSSKYFFYDPEYSFLSIGTYSALREIYFVRSLQRDCPSMKYYYMGYYIHSCDKMKYKGKYNPSYLLCPEVFTWHPIQRCVPRLDESRYSRLDEDRTKEPESIDITGTLILYKSRAMPYHVFLTKVRSSDVSAQTEQVTEYSNLAGIAASRMLLFRS